MRRLVIVVLAACAAPARPPSPPSPPAAPSAAAEEDLVSALAPLSPPGAMKGFDWKPEIAASPSETVFSNVRVLTEMRADRFMTAMMAMKASLGVKCEHCHDEKRYPADEKEPKLMARRMLLLARHVNDTTFAGETKVTCWTCHRGETKPPTAPEGFEALMAARPPHPALEAPPENAAKPARATWKNLHIMGNRMPPGIRGAMNAFTITLGVECAHCHDDKDWAGDARPAKARTREMVRLTGRINAELGARGAVTCFTCHRGKIEVPRTP